MSGWFGKSWGAPVCDEDDHFATPVGAPCERCKKPIQADDQGIIMPLADVNRSVLLLAYHLQCYLDGIICPGCPRCRPEQFH